MALRRCSPQSMDDDLQRPTFCLLSGETIRCDTANLVTAADARDAIAAALELPPERLSLVLGKAAKPGSCPEEVETLDGVCLKDHEALPEGRGCAPAVIQVCILPDPLRQNTARLLGCQPSEMELLKEADLQDSGLDLLPDSFGEQLPRLRKLRLSGNKLRLLPRTFGHLPKLQTLQAEGNDLLRLPTNFGMLRSLQELQLEENNLEVLPASFGSLESLQRLSLDCNHLRELPESFGELRSLQKLRLVKNELEALPRSFGRLQSLKDLWLSSNSIAELPEQFGSLRALQQPQVTVLASAEEDRHVIWGPSNSPSNVSRRMPCRFLCRLDCSVTEHQACRTARAFATILGDGSVATWGLHGAGFSAVEDKLTNVQQIQATESAFAAILGDGSVVTWGDATSGGDSSAVQGHLKKVRQIQANPNAFAAILVDGSVVTWGVEGCGGDSRAVQGQLKNVQQIQVFVGAFVAISNGVLERLMNVLQVQRTTADLVVVSLPFLVTDPSLRLGRNALRRLPESFGALAALRILALEENLLDELPDSFENLSSLQVLNLDGNCLREVPSSLCLPSLEKLWIGCNAVRKLPDAALHKLRGLKELSLKCNSLQWLPDSLGILGTLEVLYLQENLLEGLPSSLVALKKLRMLWLEDNKLLGLPDSCLEEHSLPALQLVRLRNSGLAAAPEARECAEAVGQPLLKVTRENPRSAPVMAGAAGAIVATLRHHKVAIDLQGKGNLDYEIQLEDAPVIKAYYQSEPDKWTQLRVPRAFRAGLHGETVKACTLDALKRWLSYKLQVQVSDIGVVVEEKDQEPHIMWLEHEEISRHGAPFKDDLRIVVCCEGEERDGDVIRSLPPKSAWTLRDSGFGTSSTSTGSSGGSAFCVLQ
eukprot:s1107_g6.t2